MKCTLPPAGIARGTRRLLSVFKKAVFPDKCAVCGELFSPAPDSRGAVDDTNGASGTDMNGDGIGSAFERLLGPYVCPVCLSGFDAFASHLCPRCGLAFKSRRGVDHLCQDCIEKTRAFHMARSLGAYGGALMGVIHAFKYQRCIELARPLAALLRQIFLTHWQDRPVDFIVPVPLHPQKMKQRGFNQSLLLSLHWERLFRRIDDNTAPRPVVAADCLVRCRPTLPQTGLNRRQRTDNMRGAFALNPTRALAGRTILLVDDVYTTGSTVGECAKVLVNGGAARVDVLTLARTV